MARQHPRISRLDQDTPYLRGTQIMLGADMRIAAPDARISLMEMRWGLVPDMAATVLLRGLVRDDVARELVYTGRQVGGEEAAALGLVTRLSADPLAEAMALARTIAASSPEAVRAAKRLMNRMADADAATLLEAESREQQALLGSDGHRRAMAAAVQAMKGG
jgi:enoyl-CoA hydratase/carnithine racemase